jgi:prolyl oligopeptidase
MRESTMHPPHRHWAQLLGTAILALASGCQLNSATKPATSAAAVPTYPPAPRTRHVDVYHGVAVADPYRWLENLDRGRTQRWVEAQNQLSQPYLESIPARAWIKQRLGELWNYERHGVPVQEGGRYFWTRNDGRQDQSVLEVADGLQAQPRLLLDPNLLSPDATIALTDFRPSPDGRFLAYALSDGGTDWKLWRVRDVETAQDLPEVLRFTKFTEVSWDRDSSGFYYSRYPAANGNHGNDKQQVVIYHHRLRDEQSLDTLVYAVKDHPTRNPYAVVTEDGQYLIIDLFDGYAANGIDYLPLRGAGKFASGEAVRLLDDWSAQYTFIGSEGPVFFFLTTQGAPRGRLIAIDTRKPERGAWRQIAPEMSESIEAASFVGGRLIATYLRDAKSLVRVFDVSGKLLHEVPLPGEGTVSGFRGRASAAETFFAYTDYVTPTAIYRYDAADNQVELFRAPHIHADTSRYVTEQVFYPSKDGTKVPMFVTRHRDLVRDGHAPLLLYGYGGFNALTLVFSHLAWCGWRWAGATICAAARSMARRAHCGDRSNKQNVFDDFSSAARWLIDNRYTRAIAAVMGRSNGPAGRSRATQEPVYAAACRRRC